MTLGATAHAAGCTVHPIHHQNKERIEAHSGEPNRSLIANANVIRDHG
jgi:hypothetical protein